MAKTATAGAKSKSSKRRGKPGGNGDAPGNSTQATWFEIEGSPFPLDVTWIAEQKAYNFSLASKHAGSITLLLYDDRPPKTARKPPVFLDRLGCSSTVCKEYLLQNQWVSV